MKKHIVIILLALSIFTLSACKNTPPSLNDRIIDTDEILEVQGNNYSGTIKQLELNLYRQGTHILEDESGKEILIQSQTINLNKYIGKNVTLKGDIAEVLGDENPAINVTEITIEGEEEFDIKEYRSVKFGFQFDYISMWELAENDKDIVLSESNNIWLKIESFYSELGIDEFTKKNEIENGTPITIGAQRSLRYISGDKTYIYITNSSKNKVYKITFNPEEKTINKEKEYFYNLLETFELIISEEKNGDECGGPRKLQCEEGYRCELSSGEKYAKGICIEVVLD